MAIAPTPNMALQKPEPQVTLGPSWAALLNTIFDQLDAHDHSSGKGARVTTAGINIDADLELNGNDLTEARSLRLENNAAALVETADKTAIYVADGDLYYNNESGTQVQITSGTGVNSSVSGAFASVTPGGYPYSVGAGNAQTVILVDSSSARTLTLPAATTAVMFCVKDVTGSAGTNPITLDPNGTDTIEGVNANYLLSKNRGWWFVISDGVSAWSVGEAVPQLIPAGSMQMYAAASAPAGWLLCDGSAISRTTYSALFSAISTTFGAGDGSTTFNIPDMRQRFPIGKAASGTGATLGGTGGAIDHTHSVPKHYHGMGVGADLNITSSGAHTHTIDAVNAASAFGLGNAGRTTGGSAAPASLIDNSASHTHASGNFAGRIGEVTGGVDGNAAMTSGTGNPPFLSLNFIIKT